MRFLKRLLGRSRYVLFSVTSGRYFNGVAWIPNESGARKYSKRNAEALALSFWHNGITVTMLEV